MSQELFKLTIGGDVLWRGCNTNSGQISLDDTSLEPLLPTLEEAVDRLLTTEGLVSPAELASERARLIEEYGHIENYQDGRFVLNLDGFFRSVERITQPEVASQLGFTDSEVAFLRSTVEAIRQELDRDKRWHTASAISDWDTQEEVYSKLFPDFDLGQGVIAHPTLLVEEVTHLDNGLRYFDLLSGSCDLDDVDE